MSQPKTPTPAERYRRAREELVVQLIDVLHLLGHLDPDELGIAELELVELLEDAAIRAEDVLEQVLDTASTPRRPVEVVDTRGRL